MVDPTATDVAATDVAPTHVPPAEAPPTDVAPADVAGGRSGIEVRRIRADEGAQLRAIRLRALADAPAAYASTLAREERQPAGAWEAAAARRCAGDREAAFVAVAAGRWVGLVGAYRPLSARSTVELVSLWTAPEARGRGVGRELVERVMAWAATPYTASVQLWVARDNDGAHRFYERLGFRETGDHQPLPSEPCRNEVRMAVRLPAPASAPRDVRATG